jgi:AsmA protein
MRRAVYIILGVAAVLLVCALALPFLFNADEFRPEIESALTKSLGRTVKIGNLKLGLMSGTVTVSDVSIADDPKFGQTPFLHTNALMLDVDLWQALFSHKLNIGSVSIDSPETVLIQVPSGMWNFSSLGMRQQSPGMGSGKLSLSMKSLKINGARLSLTQGTGQPQVLENVSIEVKDFAPESAFPFSLSTKIEGGGDVSLVGKAGPIDQANTANTPLMASFKVVNMNLAGAIPGNPAIGGVVSADGTLNSDGHTLGLAAKLTAEKLKLVSGGSAVRNPLLLDVALTEDLNQHSGQMTRGDVAIDAVKAGLTGTWTQPGQSPVLKMILSAPGAPISGLVDLLPALDIVMPSGAALEGGTAAANLTISGPVSALTISGPVSARNTRFKGFDLGAKMSPIEKLAGIKAGPNTEIETLSANLRLAPDGSTSLQDIHLVLPSVGELSGGGTISPSHALDFKMRATIHPGILVSVLTPSNIPFAIVGTSSNPQFRPDVGQLATQEITRGLNGAKIGGVDAGKAADGVLQGLFGEKKEIGKCRYTRLQPRFRVYRLLVVLLRFPVALDQRIGRTVVCEGRVALQFGHDLHRQHFAEFHAPLIERIDLPDRPLGEHVVLVERDQFAQHLRRQVLRQDHVGGVVAFESFMRNKPVRRTLRLHFRRRLAEGQRFRLREQVRRQNIVVIAFRIQRLGEANEVARNHFGSLVNQLIEGVLAVGARLAPVDGARLIIDMRAVDGNGFSVALHRQLLQISGKPLEVLVVGQHGNRLRVEEIVVPDDHQAHQHRQVLLERRGAEVLVHRMEALQHGMEIIRPDGEHGRQTDRRIHRIAPADPVPESEHVRSVDTELRHLRGIGRDGYEVACDGFFVAERFQRPVPRGFRIRHGFERSECLG